MTEGTPRLRPVTDAESDGTARLMIETGERNGEPGPLCPRSYLRTGADLDLPRALNELLNGGIVPASIKEICHVLMSTRHLCGYCSTVRSRVAAEARPTEERLMAIGALETSRLFDAREPAALPFAARIKTGEDALDNDETYEDILRHFSEEVVMELGLLCAQTDGVGKFARSLRIRRPARSSSACARWVRRAPPRRNSARGAWVPAPRPAR